jgi:2-polyprenyl-6-hydroxyphenyl methylase/3-demethylubiquinone-9 3-methyltransferase
LEINTLSGLTFLDAGSGSGLFSLAARRLGARVVSFDFDPLSVSCTQELRRRFFPDDPAWTVTEGSILDEVFVLSLGSFDFVYSWGVLHHTGALWRAADLVSRSVASGGKLFIAIYNDQGWRSRFWRNVKRFYCSGLLGRAVVQAIWIPYWTLRGIVLDLLRFRNPFARFSAYKRFRGMSMTHDWRDWLGGYPFEVARPEQVFDFFRARGFRLSQLTTQGSGLGCNEFVFERDTALP